MCVKLLIDLQSCQSGSRLGGIGRYSLNLVKSIISNCDFDCYVLLNSALPAESIVRSQLSGHIPQHKIISISLPARVAECYGDPTLTRSVEFLREYFISLMNPDIVLITSLMEGFGDDVVTSVAGLFDCNKTAVILYDLIPFVEEKIYLTNTAVKTHCYRKLEFMKQAGMLLSISEFSKSEAVEFASINSAKIYNISSAVDEKFIPKKLNAIEKKSLFEKYKIKKEYLLFTGSFDIRKNQARLIESFSLLPASLRENYQLVIVGNGKSEIYEHYNNLAHKNGLKDSEVIFVGHVDDRDLISLYCCATLFVFPSLREGFGLPVLEAISCGTAVIGSSTTSIPEVMGPNGITFDPTNAEEIASCMLMLLTDQKARDRLAKSLHDHSQNFSWTMSGLKAIECIKTHYQNINATESTAYYTAQHFYSQFLKKIDELNDGLISDQSTKNIANSAAYNEILAKYINEGVPRYTVACVSTWGIRCGIASYAKQLLESMHCEFHVYAAYAQSPLLFDDSEKITRAWSQGFDTLEHLEAQLEKSNTKIIIFQVNYGLFDFICLNRVLLRMKELGRMIILIMHSTIDPPKEKLNRSIRQLRESLNLSDLVFVHTIEDINNINKISSANVKFLPQGLANEPKFSLNPLIVSAPAQFNVATFGFFLPHKGLLEIIEAVHILRNRGVIVHLNMLNSEYPNNDSKLQIKTAKHLIDSLCLDDIINLNTNYLSDDEVINQLYKNDLIVFPYQYTNESSSAAVRIALSSGRPVAVTPVPIFDEIKDIAYVFDGESASQIADGIQHIMMMYKKNEIAPLISAAAKWVDCHRFAEIAKYLDIQLTVAE